MYVINNIKCSWLLNVLTGYVVDMEEIIKFLNIVYVTILEL